MRILLTSLEYPPSLGGVATAVDRVARGLVAAGNEVAVIARDVEDSRTSALGCFHVKTVGGVTVHTLTERLMGALRMPLLRRSVARIVDAFRPDIVHSYYVWPPGLIGQLSADRAGVPHVVSCRGADLTDEALMSPARESQVLRRADCVTTVASSLGDWARIIAGIEDTVFVPNSVSPRVFEDGELGRDEARRALNLPLDATIVGSIHGFRWKKDPDYLAQVVTEIGRSALEHVVVVLGGEYDEQLETELRLRFCERDSAGLRRSLVALPRLEHAAVPRFLCALDLFLLTSRYEGMSNVMLEALACGTPVAATAVHGALDVIRDGDVGLLLDRFDVAAASSRVVRLLRDPERLAGMAGRCRPLIRDRYLLSHELETLQNLYRSLIAKVDSEGRFVGSPKTRNQCASRGKMR